MNNPLQYTGMSLDRSDALRRQPEVIDAFWHSEQCYLVPMYQGANLFQPAIASHEPPTAVLPKRIDIDESILVDAVHIFLGQQAGRYYFAVEFAEANKDVLCEQFEAEFIDLRRMGAALQHDVVALLAYARGILFWRQQNRFCSRCGQGLAVSQGGHVLKCVGTDCGRETYPRTDPAVIMLVERTGPDGVNQCLLGRHPNWHTGFLSTLAGFVEPGESLEEAVRREVLEESGVVVGKVDYIASQPWPFPASIMLGFFAEALESEISIDPHELAEAGWFSREDLASFGEWGSENSERSLPRRDSISRFLIDHWLKAVP